MFDLELIKLKLQPDAKALDIVGDVLDRLQNAVIKHNLDAECVPGGSVAKGTFIGKDFDADLFVRFSKRYKSDQLSDLLEPVMKSFKAVRVHGSRDYFQFTHKGIPFEAIPVLNIKHHKHSENITDMSPLHVTYVQKFLTKKPQLADDIRLAKQFCKAASVYGAESHIAGISGHVLDLLVLHYGGFMNFVQRVAMWEEEEAVDPAGKTKHPRKNLNKSKIQGPLIVVDPVQADRNAAAALSKRKYDLLRKTCIQFLEKPTEKFFEIKPLDMKKLLKKDAIVVKVTPLKGKQDVVGSKIMKVYGFLKKGLAEHGFKVTDGGYDMSMIYLFVEEKKISTTYTHRGPPSTEKSRTDIFKKKWGKNVYEKDDRLHVERDRVHHEAEKCVSALLKDSYVKQRVTRCSLKR